MSKRPKPPTPPDKDASHAGDIAEFLVEAVGSQILTGGQWLLTQMKDTLGEGEPDDGQTFGAAGDRFRTTDAELGGAAPGGRWTGGGSEAYADQTARQRLRAESAADTDREVHRVLAGEAYQVAFHRRQIDELYNWLGELSEYTQWLDVIPRYGEAAKLVVETSAVQAALSSAGFELANMHNEASENAGKLKDLVGRYRAIAATAVLPDAGFGGPLPSASAPGPQADGGVTAGAMGPGTGSSGESGWAAMGGAIGGAADGEIEPGSAPPDETGAQGSPAALAGLVGLAGVVPALAAALTTPLGALLAPAGGLVAAVLQTGLQASAQAAGVSEARQQPDDQAESDAAGNDTATPVGEELIHASAEDGGTGGARPANVNAGNTDVPAAAAPTSALGR